MGNCCKQDIQDLPKLGVEDPNSTIGNTLV